jgi:acetyl esterase/lipase
MKRFLLVAFVVAAFAAVLASASAETPVAPAPHDGPQTELLEVKVDRGILYDTLEKQSLYLDLARPKEGGPYPCVVMFHGGAWIGGNRKDLSVGGKDKNGKVGPSAIEYLAARGYVVASVSYRLAPKFQFPAQIQDARSAVRFLRANAKEYNIDRDKFASAGFSAGGHLALLLGLADKVDGWDTGENLRESSRVQCIVDFFGPTDLSLYSNSPGLEDGYMVPVFGKACKTDPAIYKKASPITYIGKNAPPTLMIHGTFDLIVPIIHSENMLKKLKDVGAPAELITVRGEGHGWNGPTFTRTTNDAIRFLDMHLKGKEKK